MRVVNVYGPGDVRLDAAAVPAIGLCDALVAVKACGVCGSDVLYMSLGGMPSVGGNPGISPLPLGHEPAGEVVAVGEENDAVQVGMHVVINPMGDPSNIIGNGGTEGALADFVLVRDARLGSTLFEVPPHVPFDVAALAEPLGVALHAVNRADPAPSDKVVVFGAGPIGLGAVVWLKRRGVDEVVAVDLSQERLDRATLLGADFTINAGAGDVTKRLMERHGEEMVLGRPVAGTDIYLDAAGVGTVIEEIVAAAKYHSKLVVVAVHKHPVAIDFVQLLASEMAITTSIAYPTELAEVVAALAEDWERFAPIISDRVPFERVQEALELARLSGSAGKVMVEISSSA